MPATIAKKKNVDHTLHEHRPSTHMHVWQQYTGPPPPLRKNKQAFLEEGLVEKYVPHPLDITTLFDFLKLFEEDDDQYGTRKMSVLLDGEAYPLKQTASSDGPGDGVGLVPTASRLVRTMTETIGRTPRNAAKDSAAAVERERGGDGSSTGPKWWFGSRMPPPPTVQDPASMFFSVQGKDSAATGAGAGAEGAAAAAAGAGGGVRGDPGGQHTVDGNAAASASANQYNGGGRRPAPSSRTPGPWRPGPAAVSPGLGVKGGRVKGGWS